MRPVGLYDRVMAAREVDSQNFYRRFSGQFVEVVCPVCGTDGEVCFEKYGFSHRRCAECRTLYASPRPSEKLLEIFYTEFEAPRLWTELLLQAGRERKMLQYRPRVEKLVALMRASRQNGGADQGLTAVDLGAGSGAFALCLKETRAFEEVLAIDLSPDCVKACAEAGLSAKRGTVTDLEDASVDLICTNDLIEHVFDPALLLRECFTKLKPGGFLSIATPNGEGFDFKILKERTGNVAPPEHLTYFNPASLSRLAAKAGFKTVVVETPGILDVSIIERERDKGFDLASRNEFLDFIYDQPSPVKENFQRFLSENGLSSHLLFLGKK